MSKFEIATMVAYWAGFVIWIYGAWRMHEAKKKLDDAIELLVQSERRMRGEKDDTEV